MNFLCRKMSFGPVEIDAENLIEIMRHGADLQLRTPDLNNKEKQHLAGCLRMNGVDANGNLLKAALG